MRLRVGWSRVHWQQPMEVRGSTDKRWCRKCVTVLWAQTDIIHWFPKLCFKALRKRFAVTWRPEIKDNQQYSLTWRDGGCSKCWDGKLEGLEPFPTLRQAIESTNESEGCIYWHVSWKEILEGYPGNRGLQHPLVANQQWQSSVRWAPF